MEFDTLLFALLFHPIAIYHLPMYGKIIPAKQNMETGRKWFVIGAAVFSLAFFSEALFALVTAPVTTIIETKIIVFAVTYVLGFAALHIVVLSLLSGKINALEKRLSDLEKQ